MCCPRWDCLKEQTQPGKMLIIITPGKVSIIPSIYLQPFFFKKSQQWLFLTALRKDFEIDYRFKDLSLKLDIIKDDTRFFLEVLHNNKSTKLEWIIIILIAGEMVIGILGLGIQLGLAS